MEGNNEVQRLAGSHFIMGFEGTSITSHVKQLIEEFHVGAILLASKNLSSAEQATVLVKDLQQTAYDAGHAQPLLIAIDQENGGVNAIFDKLHIRQFPSALGVVASDSLEMARAVAVATAKELSCLGVNWITGPLLDVLANSRTQPLGVRSMGDDPQTVAQFGLEFVKGYQEGGLATCAKHFPSYGNLEFLGTPSEIPIVSETREQLRLSGLVPFEHAIRGGLDSMLVGACSMPHFGDTPITHACLSKPVVTDLLRQEMNFDGVILSDCLEIEALYEALGVGQASIMGINAGCDMLMVCSSLSSQSEAISGLRMALGHGMISKEALETSDARIRLLKSRYTSWHKALNPLGVAGLQALRSKNQGISELAYEASLSLVRDQSSWIPLSSRSPGQDLVLLTPLVDPFPTAHGTVPKSLRYLKGEDTFRELGLLIAKQWPGKVRHTSYTASGIRPLHEDLISEAAAIVLLTADCGRNAYQYAFTKYVAALCKMSMSPEMPSGKPFIVVAVSSPYDFVRDAMIGTYLCTYDFTTNAFECLVRVLFGKMKPTGFVVGTRPRAKSKPRTTEAAKPHQKWLVENFDYARDIEALRLLLEKVHNGPMGVDELPLFFQDPERLLLSSTALVECRYLAVRNSSTHALYGFCGLYVLKNISRGSIGFMFVDPDRRGLGIGRSLHSRAMKYLIDHASVKELQYGSDMPAILPGLLVSPTSSLTKVSTWIKDNYGYDRITRTQIFEITRLKDWNQPFDLYNAFEMDGFKIEVLQEPSKIVAASIMEFITSRQVSSASPSAPSSPPILAMLYSSALTGHDSSRIVMMQNIKTNEICGLSLLHGSDSLVGRFLPTGSLQTGTISSIMVEDTEKSHIYMRVLIAMAISHLKFRGFLTAQVQVIQNHPPLSVIQRLGFELVTEFQGMICRLQR